MTTPLPRPRVLLIAEAANPEWTSVPLVGWSLARALARVADVHLVTQVRNREAILRAGLVEGRDFTAIDSEALARPVFRLAEALRGGRGKGWTVLQAFSSIAYPYFEHLIWRQFKRRLIAGAFDLAHRLTPLSPTAPSLLAGRCRRIGVPFVLGPLNGGLPWPKEFKDVQRQENEWLAHVRSAHRLLPGYRATRRDAAAILVGSRDVWRQMHPRYQSKCVYVPENAIAPGRFARRRAREASRPIRAVFVGRLVPYKGADMLLEAAAPLIRAGALRLDILGDGPQRPELQALIDREDLGAGVTLHGWVEHTNIIDHLVASDLLTFPSVREFGGGVVVEAMAVGLVPVVVDYGGPGELATDRTGFLVPLGPRPQIIADLRAVLTAVTADPAPLALKSQAARRRVARYFTWDAKADMVRAVYDWALGLRPDRPDFGMPLPDESDAESGKSVLCLSAE